MMVANRAETLAQREALAELGRRYDAMGWVLGTGGNLSARSERGYVVTASGRHKGMLGVEDFVEMDGDGAIVAGPAGARPSAETLIHAAIYHHVPDANVALHVHTPTAVLARPDANGRRLRGAIGEIVFRDLEMVKAWGVMGFGTPVAMPVFENHADVPAIADNIATFLAKIDDGPIRAPALLIRSHGVTAWGADWFAANRNLETAEFLLRVRIAAIGFQGP